MNTRRPFPPPSTLQHLSNIIRIISILVLHNHKQINNSIPLNFPFKIFPTKVWYLLPFSMIPLYREEPIEVVSDLQSSGSYESDCILYISGSGAIVILLIMLAMIEKCGMDTVMEYEKMKER